MKYIAKIFQDAGGDPSSKRWALFAFILLFFIITLLVYFKAVAPEVIPFLSGVLEKLTVLIQFFGAYVAAEQVTKFAPKENQ